MRVALLRGSLGALLGLLAVAIQPPAAAAAPPTGTAPGERIYRARCRGCHEATGAKSTGPALKGILKPGRRPEAEVRRIITEGKEMMPAFRGRLTPKDLDDLIGFLRTL
jgi:mono/diheme cytochrome c family protein